MAEPEYLRLLRAEVAKRGSIGKAATAAGISRASASTLLAGKYPAGSTAEMERRIMTALGQVECPHLGATIGRRACADLAGRPCPTSSPDALRHWRACQRCDHNPNTGG